MPDFNAFSESFFSDRRQEQEPMDWEDAPFLPEVSAPFVPSRPPRKMRSLISVQVSEPPSLSANRFPNMRALVPKTGGSVSLHSRGCPDGLRKRAASRDHSSRPPRGVPRATLCIEQMTAADGLLSSDKLFCPFITFQNSSNTVYQLRIFPLVKNEWKFSSNNLCKEHVIHYYQEESFGKWFGRILLSIRDRRQEQEPMDWEDAPFLPEVSAPFVPSRPPRKMRSLISVQVSEPPSLSANRFPNMRALVPKTGGSVSLHSRGCPDGLRKRAASRDHSSRPPRGVPRATLCIEQMTAADGLLSSDKLFCPFITFQNSSNTVYQLRIFPLVKNEWKFSSNNLCKEHVIHYYEEESFGKWFGRILLSIRDRRQEQEPMDWEDAPFLPEVSAPFVPSRPPRKMRSLISVQVSEPPSLSANRFPNMRALVPKTGGSVSLHSRGCPEGLRKRAASRDHSSRPPRGVPRATLCIEQMTAADGLLSSDKLFCPFITFQNSSNTVYQLRIFPLVSETVGQIFAHAFSFFYYCNLDRRQEQEPLDWEDAPFLPEVSAHFVPSRPPRKMRSLISVQVSEPPSLSANRFPNMRALVPKTGGSVSLHSRGCPEGLRKRAASRDHSSRPPRGVPRATLCIEQMTAADGLLSSDKLFCPFITFQNSSNTVYQLRIFPLVSETVGQIFAHAFSFFYYCNLDRRQEQEPMDWEDAPFLPEVSAPFVPSRPPRKMRSLISVQVSEPPSLSANRFPNMRALVPKTGGSVSLHSRGCPEGLRKRAASRDHSSRPPRGVPRATLCIEQMTAADGLLSSDKLFCPFITFQNSSNTVYQLRIFPLVSETVGQIFAHAFSFFYYCNLDRRQEQEPMDWEDAPFLPEVSAPFVPSRPPRKMRSLISVQVSEPPSLSANRFPNMRALVPKTGGSVSLHSRGCPEGLRKRAASRDHSSRPPRGVPRATLCIEQMTAADGLLSSDKLFCPFITFQNSSNTVYQLRIFPLVSETVGQIFAHAFSFFYYCNLDRRQEQEPMDWEDAPFLPEVSAPFVPSVPTEDEVPHLRSDRRQEQEPMDWEDAPFLPETGGSVSLHSRGCPEGLRKRAASRDHSSRPPRGVPRATLCIEQMTAADGLLSSDKLFCPFITFQNSSNTVYQLRIFPLVKNEWKFSSNNLCKEHVIHYYQEESFGKWFGRILLSIRDDRAILSRHRNLDTLVENINEHLAHLETWFSVWKIALNSSKTEAVFFSKRKPPLKLLYKIKEYPGLNTPSILV
ncbi:hypothetical protein TNCV_1589111 [Trichonephila clavipes]|uniref:Uncharacterized protein n=1 Tax=Trichonephila clavipes TaxID=2585209 RepID=A0A8X6V5C3_TRICX|nr:hypothetical protein TNCV_1589111 [Trichonephila clavipes]